MIRIFVRDAINDQYFYDDVPPENVNRTVKEIWYSFGGNGEMESPYYVRGLRNTGTSMIDFYTFQQLGSRSGKDNSASSSSDDTDAWFQGSSTQAEEVFEVESCCQQDKGKRMIVHYSRSRNPSHHAAAYFDLKKPVPCRDRTDKCILAVFANNMALIDGREAARAYWHRITRLDRQEARRMGYRKYDR